MAKTYILKDGSLHDRFNKLRTQIQFFGGGYGNGKTSAMVIKALQIAKDYPGCNILMARSTYPKLNDTLRKTFIEFCPQEWIASFPMSKNSENTCTLKNGSKINFRYIAQRSSTDDGGSTSNLLSATYDCIVVDQMEDPEIIHKDFIDLLGRLRGSTVYRGTDPTMPRTGPRWFLISCNPTRNWVYKEIIAPYHKYIRNGTIDDKLIMRREKDTRKPLLGADGKPILLMSVVEGSTYENAHVLEADFIELLESTYTGQMRDRFLKGEWASYEGLIYPEFDELLHVVRHDRVLMYMTSQIRSGAKLNWIEGYDYGLRVPSCYLLAFTDLYGNVFIVDGFYQPEASIQWQANEIRRIRHLWGIGGSNFINGDPSIFRRGAGGDSKLVGKSVSEMFWDEDRSLTFQRGNNDIATGLQKVASYIRCYKQHSHPITGEPNAPLMYVSDNLTYLIQEFGQYYWKTDSKGEKVDEPIDKNDHAMDTVKYMLTYAPEPARLMRDKQELPKYLHQWNEVGQEEWAV